MIYLYITNILWILYTVCIKLYIYTLLIYEVYIYILSTVNSR